MSKKGLKNVYVNQVIRSFAEERVLKQEYIAGPLNRDLFDLGEYCYQHPEKMKELSEKILNSRSFINGYERAKRLVLIAKLEKGSGKSR